MFRESEEVGESFVFDIYFQELWIMTKLFSLPITESTLFLTFVLFLAMLENSVLPIG